jgi:O-methyltransferase
LLIIKKFIKFFLYLFSYELKKTNYRIIFQEYYYRKFNFYKYYRICKNLSINVSYQRYLSLFQSLQYILKNKIKGDIVECGVFKGGSAMMICYFLKLFLVKNKKIWLYDTYEGMSTPSRKDVDLNNKRAKDFLNEKKIENKNDVWAFSSLNSVKNNIKKTNFNIKNCIFIKGKVEKTLKVKKPKYISLLRLDTDFYHSTKAELQYLYNLISPGGIIIIDDYGHWKGCKLAVDQFFKKKKNILILNVDYTGIIGIKLK